MALFGVKTTFARGSLGRLSVCLRVCLRMNFSYCTVERAALLSAELDSHSLLDARGIGNLLASTRPGRSLLVYCFTAILLNCILYLLCKRTHVIKLDLAEI